MARAVIRKVDGKWSVVRTAFGFSPHLETATFPTHEDAVNSLEEKKHGSVTVDTSRTYTPTYGAYWWGHRYNNFPMRIT